MVLARLRIATEVAVISVVGGVVVATGAYVQQEPAVSIQPEKKIRHRPSGPPPNARIDVNQVLVPVTVTDSLDRPVMNLPRDSFRVFEDEVEQRVVSFFREEGPVSIGFVFDGSSSMANRMDRSTAAIDQFLKTTVPGDEYFLVQFNDCPTILSNFTQKPDDISSQVRTIQPQGWTALNDAIFLAALRMKHAKNPRRALVILTDGGDNNSRYTEAEVRSLVRESDLRVYAIGIFEKPRFLKKLAAETGGGAVYARNLDELPAAIETLSQEFRNQYVLGYASQNKQNDGKYRKVRVELLKSIRSMPLRVFWRRGYYAPN